MEIIGAYDFTERAIRENINGIGKYNVMQSDLKNTYNQTNNITNNIKNGIRRSNNAICEYNDIAKEVEKDILVTAKSFKNGTLIHLDVIEQSFQLLRAELKIIENKPEYSKRRKEIIEYFKKYA